MPGEVENSLGEEKGLLDTDNSLGPAGPGVKSTGNSQTAVGHAKGRRVSSESVNDEKGKEDDHGKAQSWWRRCRVYTKLLYVAFLSGAVNMGHGSALAFSSPFIDEMTKNLNSTPWSEGFDNCFYQSLIGPSVIIGAFLAGATSSVFVAIFGLVFPLCLSALMFTIGWSMIGISWFVSDSPTLFSGLILAGRFVTGLGDGWNTSVWGVYFGEVCPSKYRFAFVGVGYILYSFGVIQTYLLGSYLPYWICSFIYGGTMVVAVVLILLTLPESPSRIQGIFKNTKSLLSALRNKTETVALRCKFSGNFLRRLFMVEMLFFFNAFMGHVAMIQYIGPIFEVAGASQWRVPRGVLLAITVGGIEMVGFILATFISGRFGHILSCFIGATGLCIGNLGMGVYFLITVGFDPNSNLDIAEVYLNSTTSDSQICFFKPSATAIGSHLGEKFSPLALISVAATMVMYGMFWMMQPYVIAVELFTDNTRGLGMGITSSSCSFFHFSVSFLFPWVERSIGTAATFFSLSLISAIGAVLVPTLVPETKGRPMGERGDKFTPKQNWLELFQEFLAFNVCCKNRQAKSDRSSNS